jgi:TRAP transporter TAXI family solute receptor
MLMTVGVTNSNIVYGDEVINIATAGVGGSYYPVGAGIAKIITQHVEGANGSAEVTGASIENIKLLGRGKVRLAFVEPAFAAVPAYMGIEVFDKKIETRVVSALHFSTGSPVVLKKSGIKKITDLKGKRVAVGKMGSMTSKATEYLLKAYGLSFKDIETRYLGHSEAAEALGDGSIDCAILVGAPPAASIMSVAATHDIDILSGDEKHMEKMKSLRPGLGAYLIPKNTYKGVDHDSWVWMSGLILLCRPDESDALIYNIVKAMYENEEIIAKSHPAAKVITLENAVVDFGIPYHDGAMKYYKERGVSEK